MVRCLDCRFLFEPSSVSPLPACPQCGGDTVAVERIAPGPAVDDDEFAPQPTGKFISIKT